LPLPLLYVDHVVCMFLCIPAAKCYHLLSITILLGAREPCQTLSFLGIVLFFAKTFLFLTI
jgi:hypothetical protein